LEAAPSLARRSCGYAVTVGKEVTMPTWLWVLIIVLVVLALFGGVGYRRW
jgi:hypothetical protein